MKIIENNKLFGKINMLDIIIILVMLLIGMALIMLLGKKDIISNNQYTKLKYSIEIKEMPKGSNEIIKIGDKVYDNEINSHIGEIVNFYPKDNIKIEKNFEKNEFVESINPEKENIYIEIQAEVKENDSDFKTASDYAIKVGKQVNLRGSNFSGTGYIMQIER